MANRPDIHKRKTQLRISIELLRKIALLAQRHGRDEFAELVSILEEGTRDVVLSSRDYEIIKQEVKHNEDRRKRQNRIGGSHGNPNRRTAHLDTQGDRKGGRAKRHDF